MVLAGGCAPRWRSDTVSARRRGRPPGSAVSEAVPKNGGRGLCFRPAGGRRRSLTGPSGRLGARPPGTSQTRVPGRHGRVGRGQRRAEHLSVLADEELLEKRLIEDAAQAAFPPRTSSTASASCRARREAPPRWSWACSLASASSRPMRRFSSSSSRCFRASTASETSPLYERETRWSCCASTLRERPFVGGDVARHHGGAPRPRRPRRPRGSPPASPARARRSGSARRFTTR